MGREGRRAYLISIHTVAIGHDVTDDCIQVVVGRVVKLVAHVSLHGLLALVLAPPDTGCSLAPDSAPVDARVPIVKVAGTHGIGLVQQRLKL